MNLRQDDVITVIINDAKFTVCTVTVAEKLPPDNCLLSMFQDNFPS